MRWPVGRLFGDSERTLEGEISDYRISRDGDHWTVRHVPTGELIYSGPGPVEIVRSPAPF